MKKWMIAAVVFGVSLFGASAFGQAGSAVPSKGQAPPTAQNGLLQTNRASRSSRRQSSRNSRRCFG